MKAIILAGGLGTRLRPLTCTMPKPLVPMLNRPIMAHTVDLLSRFDFKDIIVLLHYQGDLIKNYFGDGKEYGVKMSYIDNEEDFGTAGSVGTARKSLDDTFIVISGDLLTDFDLSKILKFHKEKKSMLTIVLTRVKNPLEFGIVITNKDGKIEKFLEKPAWGEVFTDTINTGIYVIDPKVLDYISEGTEVDFSKDLFPLLMEKGIPLYGYITGGYWRDLGTISEYSHAHYEILGKEMRMDFPGHHIGREGENAWAGKETTIDPTVLFKGAAVIGNNCVVKKNAILEDVVIGDNCIVEEGAQINKCTIWSNTIIGSGSHLKENVIGKNCKIGNNVFMEEGAIIGDDCYVGNSSLIRQSVKIWPHKVIENEAIVSTSLVWGEKWAKSLFGTYGVTGLSNIEITPEFSAKLGAAYGASLQKGSTVITSRDSHRASRMIKRSFIAGLLSSGINVGDVRDMPLPVTRYTLRTSGEYTGGIHVRMSPIDPKLMDIKFFDALGMDISSGKERTIERLFFREDFRRASLDETGNLEVPSRVIQYYREGFLSGLDTGIVSKRKFKVVIDYAFSSAANIFPSLIGELGCEVIALNAYADDKKGAKTEEEFNVSLKQLSNIVLTLKADVGFLFDTGAEKIFIVDEKGNLLSSDMTLSMVTMLVLKSRQKSVIAVPVTASHVIEEMAKEYKAKVVRTKTNPHSMMAMGGSKEINFIGETKGGFIFPEFQPSFDAMFSIGKILELLAKNNMTIGEMELLLPKRYMVRESVFCPWELKGKIMRLLVDETSNKERDLIEGIKIYEKGRGGIPWVIILPDEDRALFHINAEADTPEEARELGQKYIQKIKEWEEQ